MIGRDQSIEPVECRSELHQVGVLDAEFALEWAVHHQNEQEDKADGNRRARYHDSVVAGARECGRV
jgi:hypothetical protein